MAEREGGDGPGLTVGMTALRSSSPGCRHWPLSSRLISNRGRASPRTWFEDPLHFLRTPGEMRRESTFLYEDGTADYPRGSALFHVVRGSVSGPGDLPWLDVEQAFNIAVNSRPGDDVAIALDYCTGPSDPRVVGSDAWTARHQIGRVTYVWRQVASSFSAFAEALGLLASG